MALLQLVFPPFLLLKACEILPGSTGCDNIPKTSVAAFSYFKVLNTGVVGFVTLPLLMSSPTKFPNPGSFRDTEVWKASVRCDMSSYYIPFFRYSWFSTHSAGNHPTPVEHSRNSFAGTLLTAWCCVFLESTMMHNAPTWRRDVPFLTEAGGWLWQMRGVESLTAAS